MEWAIAEIHKIQHAARSGHPITKPQWPVLILRTPKGISGPKTLGDEIIEGSFHSHQVPLPKAKTDKAQLEALNDWLKHYRPQELFDKETGAPVEGVLSVVPEREEKRMGMRRETYDAYRPLRTPGWMGMGVEKGKEESCMKVVGEYLREVMEE